MKEPNTHDNITLFELPDIDFKDFPEMDFNLEPFDLELPEVDFNLDDIDLDLNFDGILDDKDFDLPVLDFTELPGLDINEGGTK